MDICLACGGPAVAGVRRVLGVSGSVEVTLLWKEMISKELQRSGKTLDFMGLISQKVGYNMQKVLLCL